MKNNNFILRFTVALAFIVIAFISCQEKIEYPIEPHIEFLDFVYILNEDSIAEHGLLTLSFTDGDGDLGEEIIDDSTLPTPPLNLFIDYFELQDGDWKQIINEETGDTLVLHGTMPYLTPGGKNKNISGTIEQTLFINIFNDYDTFRYEVYIQDRALHKSNTVITPSFIKKR